MGASMGDERRGAEARPPDRAEGADPVGGAGIFRAAAPSADLPFEQFAALGAHLADRLRLVAPRRTPIGPVL